MSAGAGGYGPLHQGSNDRAPHVDGYGSGPRGSGQRVVGLGAICDYRSGGGAADESVSFWVGEFVVLDDGQRILLHQARGFTSSFTLGGDVGTWDGFTRESIRESVLMVVLPDDDESPDNHPWAWLAQLARAKGIEVTADELPGVPYEVVLTDRVERWLVHLSGPLEGE